MAGIRMVARRCAARSPPRRRRPPSRVAAVARSYVSEARRRGLAGAETGSGRSSSASRRSTPTRRSRCASAPTSSLYLGDALRPDDRREREPRHRAALREVPPAGGLSRRPGRAERDIFATGFYRQKTKSIRGAMRVLLEEFDGVVPHRLEDLLRLPGVACKTANVVAAELGHAQGIVVDTHVRKALPTARADAQRGPGQDRAHLQRVVPRADWARFPICHLARAASATRRPLCEECVPTFSGPGSEAAVREADRGRFLSDLGLDPLPHDEPRARLLLPEQRVAGRRDDPACTAAASAGSPQRRRRTPPRLDRPELVRTSGA